VFAAHCTHAIYTIIENTETARTSKDSYLKQTKNTHDNTPYKYFFIIWNVQDVQM